MEKKDIKDIKTFNLDEYKRKIEKETKERIESMKKNIDEELKAKIELLRKEKLEKNAKKRGRPSKK